jgi:hypothetical protein
MVEALAPVSGWGSIFFALQNSSYDSWKSPMQISTFSWLLAVWLVQTESNWYWWAKNAFSESVEARFAASTNISITCNGGGMNVNVFVNEKKLKESVGLLAPLTLVCGLITANDPCISLLRLMIF